VFTLQRPAQGQVLRQRQQRLLQNRLFQVRLKQI
jgi:hypothetical protein